MSQNVNQNDNTQPFNTNTYIKKLHEKAGEQRKELITQQTKSLLFGSFVTMYEIQDGIREERNKETPNGKVIIGLTEKLYKEPIHSIEKLLPLLSSADIIEAQQKARNEIDKRRNNKSGGKESATRRKNKPKGQGGKESKNNSDRPKPYGGYYNCNTKKRKNKRKSKKRR